MRLVLLTLAALMAFAANSILCRLALSAPAGTPLIDAASFTSIRLFSGAIMLLILVLPSWRRQSRPPMQWGQAASLWLYMICFSFAYIDLDTGSGALILFATVQFTMFGLSLRQGERYAHRAWLALGIAFGGLVVLVAPGLSQPSVYGAALMALAGVGWGVYSILGRTSPDPLSNTANNFIAALPGALLVSLLSAPQLQITLPGAFYAILSGALASAVGYAVWYHVLPQISAGRAATVQLAVPALAALGGVLWVGEPLTWRLLIAIVMTLSGIYWFLRQRT